MEPEVWIITQRIGAREIDPIVFEATRTEAERYVSQVYRDAMARPESSIEVQLIRQSTAQTIISYSARNRAPTSRTSTGSKGTTTVTDKGVFPQEPGATAGLNPWILAAVGGAVWYFGFRKRG